MIQFKYFFVSTFFNIKYDFGKIKKIDKTTLVILFLERINIITKLIL